MDFFNYVNYRCNVVMLVGKDVMRLNLVYVDVGSIIWYYIM